jgi:hypothetical protein
MVADNITETSAVLSWDAIGGSTDYQLSVAGIGVIYSTSNSNRYTVTGLASGSKISWSVRSVCSGVTSEWVSGPAFNTKKSGEMLASRLHNSQQKLTTEDNLSESTNLTLYPNPSVDEVYLSLLGNEKITSFTIMNVQGVTISRLSGIDSNFETIKLKEFGTGLYVIKVEINNKYFIIRKAIIR